MKNIIAFALLLGLSFTQLATASESFTTESSIVCGCDKCGKKDCDGSCDGKGEKKSCSKKDKKSCCKKSEKKSCCKKDAKSCKKKEDKKEEE
jgi:hypothetical protein